WPQPRTSPFMESANVTSEPATMPAASVTKPTPTVVGTFGSSVRLTWALTPGFTSTVADAPTQSAMMACVTELHAMLYAFGWIVVIPAGIGPTLKDRRLCPGATLNELTVLIRDAAIWTHTTPAGTCISEASIWPVLPSLASLAHCGSSPEPEPQPVNAIASSGA